MICNFRDVSSFNFTNPICLLSRPLICLECFCKLLIRPAMYDLSSCLLATVKQLSFPLLLDSSLKIFSIELRPKILKKFKKPSPVHLCEIFSIACFVLTRWRYLAWSGGRCFVLSSEQKKPGKCCITITFSTFVVSGSDSVPCGRLRVLECALVL